MMGVIGGPVTALAAEAAQVYTRQISCRMCGGRLHRIADFGKQALTSIFPKPGESPPVIPLELMRCGTCALLQLAHTTNPRIMYREGYGYKSGVNESMVAHLAWVAGKCKKYITQPARVCDIGCNDGTLLRQFEGNVRVGFDPVGSEVEDCLIVRDYFRPTQQKFDLITSVAMFYDLNDPVTFAKQVFESLTLNGVWFLEMQYVGALQDGMWDQVCHEHICYYGLTQIAQIAWSAGMHIVEYGFTDTNGGSIWCVIGKVQKGCRIADTTEKEAKWQWDDFERECQMSAKNIRLSLGKRTVWVMGASTKGNMILQYCGIGPEQIVCAVDRNPDKAGRTTSNGIPIRDESSEANPDAFLVLPYHFRDGILKRYAALRDKGVKFIFPLPRVDEV